MLEDESYFSFDEIFFSTTDHKGAITSGNPVFTRVSEFEWKELAHKPHNIIRHPHMPRGVFYLFWKTLTDGHPIGAYVKNRSKTGKYYWVFALAQSVPGGYLSVRIKPSSELFKIVQNEYQKLYELERVQKLSPESSFKALNNRILELGFENYNELMTTALMTELASRRKHLGLSELPILSSFESASKINKDIQHHANEMFLKFKEGRLLPLNLTAQSAKLGTEGSSLIVVANQYSSMAAEIEEEFKHFMQVLEKSKESVLESQYAACAALLQVETLKCFQKDSQNESAEQVQNLGLLQNLHTQGLERSRLALFRVQEALQNFLSSCTNIQSLSTGLEIVRLTGKIEISSIKENQESLKHILDSLHKFRSYLDTTIKEITRLGSELQIKIKEIGVKG